jgi:hypothetical protein
VRISLGAFCLVGCVATGTLEPGDGAPDDRSGTGVTGSGAAGGTGAGGTGGSGGSAGTGGGGGTGGAITTSTDVARVFDEEHVLVVPDGEGLGFLANDGTWVHRIALADITGPCPACTGEGVAPDGDGLLFCWAAGFFTGGVARLDGTGALEWSIDGLAFPHGAVRDPFDDTVIVPEAGSNSVRWYPGDGASDEAVRVLDDGVVGWSQDLPNGIDKIEHEGRTFIVVSNRGGGMIGFVPGKVSLWEVTDPDEPALLWKFPATGDLDTPHGAIMRFYEGRWWLLYAHSYGAPSGGGSIGLAVADAIDDAPQYVADLVPPAPAGPFDFVRGVEITDDGWLWMADSGPNEGLLGDNGRILKAPMPPDLEPTGASGAEGEDQLILPLADTEVTTEGVANPFHLWLWRPTFPL